MQPINELVPAAYTLLGTQDRHCDKHGPYTAKGSKWRHREAEDWSPCPGCDAEQRAAHERQIAEDHERAEQQRRQLRIEARLQAVAIPPRFLERTLSNFKATTEAQRKALEVVSAYVANYDSNAKAGRGLVLAGRPGTGKSHLATAALREALEHTSGLYTTCLGMIQAVRNTWRKDAEAGESEVLDNLGRVGLLVLDEVGVQYGTEGEQTILFDVLDRRYRDMRPTILLTNQDAPGLKAYLGERVFDRVSETCQWVPFAWESYRPTAKKEALHA